MAMVRSAVKKNRRKSQQEAARLQKQADAVLAMEDDEEIHFNRPETIPDTPRVSQNNTPDPEDEDRGEKDYTVVLEMVKAVRDRLAALILDNTGEAIAGRPGRDQSLRTGRDQTAPSYMPRVDRWRG